MNANKGTPSFTKTGSNMHDDSQTEHDCDFTEDMIDEHVGISSSISSPQFSSQHSSMCKILSNFDDPSKHQQGNDSLKRIPTSLVHNHNHNCNRQASPRALQELKVTQRQVQNNFSQHISRKQKKIRDLKQELEQKQMEQCTFAPNTHQTGGKKRNFVQFLKSQQDHVTKISQKNEELRRTQQQTKKQEQYLRPKISKAHNPTLNCNKTPVYERLYELKQNKQVKNKQNSKQIIKTARKQKTDVGNNARMGNSNLNKKKPSPCSLFDKAQRRQQLARSISQSKIVQISQNNDLCRSKSKNKLNDFYGAQKFIKEYCIVLENLDMLKPAYGSSARQHVGHNDADIWHREFNLEEFKSILNQLGFLFYNNHTQCESAVEQGRLAAQGYHMIQQFGTDIRNICVFLLGVIGIFSINPNCLRGDRHYNSCQELKFTETEGRKVQNYFDLLYRNRLVSQRSRYSQERQSNIENTTYQMISPRHGQHTRQLASKYRSKMVERANERFVSSNIDIVLSSEDQLTHEDLLVIDRIGKTLELTRQREERMKQLDDQCTFHPQINACHSACSTDRGREKSKQLYQQAKTKFEFERSKNQHQAVDNFDPSLYTAKNSKTNRGMLMNKSHQKAKSFVSHKDSSAEKLDQIKDVRKTIARMTLGRKQREIRNKQLQRGQPEHLHSISAHNRSQKSNTKSVMDSSRHNISPNAFRQVTDEYSERTDRPSASKLPQSYGQVNSAIDSEPFLVIDVNMGNEVGQILFNTGDEKRVGSIVDDFCLNFDLDEECKAQLLELVQVQMSKYINNIGVQSTGTEDQNYTSTQREPIYPNIQNMRNGDYR